MAAPLCLLRPVANEAPRPGDLVIVHTELTFTTTAQTVTHTIETENVIWCLAAPHGTTVAEEDTLGWSISGTTLTISRGATGTSGLIATVVYAGAPIGVQV
jgi:hypothetical protein